jgi:hypothetical protein
MNIKSSLTNKNKNLYNDLIKDITIDFKVDATETCWTAKRTGTDTYLITAPDNYPSPESLTHELLHLRLALNGFVGTEDILADQRFVFCQWQLVDAINNNLAHFHMLERFVSLGLDKEKFLFQKPTNLETEYFSEISTLNPSADPLQYVNFLLQTVIKTSWYKVWLLLDTKKIDNDLKLKNDKIYEDTNSVIYNWIKSSSDKNLETFLELQKVHAAGQKAYR